MKSVVFLTFLIFYSSVFSQKSSEYLQIEKVFVQGGQFRMGSQKNEKYRNDDEHQVMVELNDFYISKTEITYAQYIEFLNETGVRHDGTYMGIEYVDTDDLDCALKYENEKFYFSSNYLIQNENFPMTEVTWAGADAYAKYAGGRLPTEAEWEFAARGGVLSEGYINSGSDTIRKVAVYKGTSKRKMKETATMNPNELGLFDMSGSVWEWCSDWYGPYEIANQLNPTGPKSGRFRVIRGGSWNCYAEDCRIAYRGNRDPKASGTDCGLRIVFDK